MNRTQPLRRQVPSGLAAALILCAACGAEEEPQTPSLRSVRYTVVARGADASARTFSGVVRAGTESQLGFQMAGRVVAVEVDVGDIVEAGQVIARIDPADVEIQISQARASAAQAGAQARGASATYERTRALYESNSASRQDLDNARSQRDAARAASSAASASVRGMQRQLEQTTITAPSAGTISAVEVESNAVVSPGQPIAMLQVGEQLVVAVDVPETFINTIARGDTATVRIEAAGDDSIEGTVFEVGAPTRGNAVFPVTVRLPNGLSGVRAGLAAEVSIERDSDEDTIVLPVSAVNEDGEGRYVYVLTSGDGEGDSEDADEDDASDADDSTEDDLSNTGTVHRRSVTVGPIDANGLVIEDGLEPGERVVTAGVSRIYDGLRVRVPRQPGALR